MQHYDDVFNSPYVRKHIAITYKRRKKAYNAAIQNAITMNASTTTSLTNDITPFTHRTSKRTHSKTPLTNKTKRTRTKDKYSQHNTLNDGMTSSPIADIFAFPSVDGTNTQLEFRRTSSFPQSSNNNSDNDNNRQAPSINSTINLRSTPLLDTKKRKRNLVSQLRSANDEYKDRNAQIGDAAFFSVFPDSEHNNDTDDDSTLFCPANDSNDIMSLTKSPLLSPLAPTDLLQEHHARMDQMLAELNQSEFEQDEMEEDAPAPPPTMRQPYVPENTIRAPITYSRSNIRKVPTTTSHELDLETLIKYTLSGDF